MPVVETYPDGERHVATCTVLDAYGQGATEAEALAELGDALYLLVETCRSIGSYGDVVELCGCPTLEAKKRGETPSTHCPAHCPLNE